ncbi:MAG TPA: TonB-dependent receptor [Petrimonas sp.]|uniref:SusC/RagA family TonB-linked outer membrane protein n=1 Tax=Petrimonas sp. TaxID=2023866 RepID=UPI000964E15F|nr:MAG: SusC/RagA family protein [Bacteroidia bacterium 43-41]HHV86723.1 TonB-dependent receptor [Petrimonas sp.]
MKRKLFLFLTLFLVGIGIVTAQTQVRGTVVDEAGVPIIGATIQIKGTTQGTVTNLDGNFSLVAPAEATLVVSFVGLITQEVAVAPTVNVVLMPDTELLEEIVVVGYGTQRKRDVTSSISQIRGEDLASKASPSFMQQMAGRASGVQVIAPSGDVTQPPRVIIRGVGTISSSNAPLYVINGVPVTSGNVGYSYSNNNALADINPSDIESFEILKDGAATAIYGSRAANGVVLITTKQGKQGAAKITYDSWMGWSSAAKLYDLLNAEQFVTIANEKYTNSGGNPQAKMDDKGTDTNWYDYVFRTGFQHSHTVSISGASPQTQYFMSAGYTDQKGLSINNSYNRYTFYAKAEHKFLRDYVTAGFSLNASNQVNTGPVKGTNSISDNMYASSRMLPNVAVYNPDDPTGFNIDPNDRKSLAKGANLRTIENTIPNIVWVLKNNRQKNSSYRILPTANIDIRPVSWLMFRSLVGADVNLIDDSYVWMPESGDGFGYKGLINRSSIKRQRWNFQNILSANKSFGLHNLDATAVAEWTNYVYNRFTAGARDFSDPFFVDEIISDTYVTQSSGGSVTTNGLASYIFRANYNYNSIFYIGGSVRRDGISNLHKDNRWGTFYGGSAAVRISGLDFWKNSSINDIVSDFRLRGSFAEVGNDRLSGDFMYNDIFAGQKYGDQAGIAYYQAGNPALKWEKQKILDFGFDAAFLHNRFNLVFAYWQKDNSDIVLDVPTPPSLGIPWNVIAQNYGKINNNGIELELGGNIIQNKGLIWKTAFNFSTQQSKVVTLVNDIPYEHYILREGESMNALWGYRYAGVNMKNGNPMYYKKDGSIIQGNIANTKYYVYNPSDPADLSKASNLVQDDKEILGNSLPTWFGGWDNTVTLKNFDFNIFFRFSGGNKIANVTRRDMLDQGFTNSSTEILGRWQSESNPGDGNVPKLYYGRGGFINLTGEGSSRWIESGDFLKLQNLSVGYNFPKGLCSQLWVEKVRIYVQGQNLATFTKYSGLDPEGYTVVPGVDWNGNPQQRTFLIGLNIGF